ncbi:hypothetical protein SAMN02910358_01536 [Lachnospiraceae bacterium XBB1006]|nr:hypothetical protein SAMN02910358_01536 [Lachnospiraceae bacterium XBB1006]
MIALQFTEVKAFMNKLLLEPMFHHFLLAEATIINGVSYTIDGHIANEIRKSSPEEFPNALATYATVQPILLEMVKGSRTPSYMKFVFCLSPENVKKTLASIQSGCDPDAISGMYINATFQGEYILVTTGVSYSVFVKDHALEQEWDRFVKLFFTKNQLYFETMS